jgi:hypothetical protein
LTTNGAPDIVSEPFMVLTILNDVYIFIPKLRCTIDYSKTGGLFTILVHLGSIAIDFKSTKKTKKIYNIFL